MGFIARFRRAALKFIYRKRVGSRWAEVLVDCNVWPLKEFSVDSSGSLVLPQLGLSVPFNSTMKLPLLRGVRLALALKSRAGATIRLLDDAIELDFGKLRMVALSDVDLGVMHEVFVERLYDLYQPAELLVIDIGANIGAASLFFATEFGAEVWAYELVPSTSAIAGRNLALNEEVCSRIRLHDVGLFDKNMELEILVDDAFRPSNSFVAQMSGEGSHKESVKVIDVARVVQEAVDFRQSRMLVAKIDAEGAEYEIIERLREAELLGKIDILLLEWHERSGKEPAEIRAALLETGFRWFEYRHRDAPVGFISAYRA